VEDAAPAKKDAPSALARHVANVCGINDAVERRIALAAAAARTGADDNPSAIGG